jgi:hypothetical protein
VLKRNPSENLERDKTLEGLLELYGLKELVRLAQNNTRKTLDRVWGQHKLQNRLGQFSYTYDSDPMASVREIGQASFV